MISTSLKLYGASMTNNSNIKRYVRVTLLIVIFPLVFGSMLIAVFTKSSMDNRALLEKELQNHALLQNTMFAEYVERTIDSLNSTMLLLHQHHRHHAASTPEEFLTLLRRYAIIEPAIKGIFILDEHGNMEFTTQRRLVVDLAIGQRLTAFHTQQLLDYHMFFDTESQRFFSVDQSLK